jgi:hypothetical protein
VLVVDDEDFFPCDISDEADALLQQAIKVGLSGIWRSTGTYNKLLHTVFTLRKRAVACLAMCLSDLDHAMPHVFRV